MNSDKYNYIQKTYFKEVNSSFSNSKKAVQNIKGIIDILKSREDADLFTYSYDELCEMLSKAELLALDIRKSLAVKEEKQIIECEKTKHLGVVKTEATFLQENDIFNATQIRENIERRSINKMPVEFEFDGKLCKVYTPLTFKRGFVSNNMVSNYLLANYLKTEIRKWENNNQFSLKKAINSPYIIVMKRVDFDFSIFKNCDGDNIENQRIINALTEAFRLPDNAKFMSLFSIWDVAKDDEKPGMYFYIFSQENLNDYQYLLIKDNVNQE